MEDEKDWLKKKEKYTKWESICSMSILIWVRFHKYVS